MSTLKLTDPAKAREYFEAKLAFTTGPVELSHMIDEGESIHAVDVRAEEDFKRGHITHAFNLPIEKWDTLASLRKDRINVVYCYSQTCHLAARAAALFASKGFPVMELEGGYEAWKKAGLEIEKARVSVGFISSKQKEHKEEAHAA